MVRVERVTAGARHPHDEAPACAQYPPDLGEQRGRLGDVFQHVVQDDAVEPAVLERQPVRLHRVDI